MISLGSDRMEDFNVNKLLNLAKMFWLCGDLNLFFSSLGKLESRERKK